MEGASKIHTCLPLPLGGEGWGGNWKAHVSFSNHMPSVCGAKQILATMDQPFGLDPLRLGYCAGIVINGSFSGEPVSARVKKNMTAVSARFVCQSPSSIQNQWSR